MRLSSRLALGTAQFGLRYGIANRTGQVAHGEAARIVERARSAGLDTIDTAIAYGDSESTLGEVGVAAWCIVSKLPPIPPGVADVEEWVERLLTESLGRLRVPALYGLLLHRSADLAGPHGDAIARALQSARQRKLVSKIGVSIYSPDELDALADRFAPDLVQSPYNVIDRRLETSGWLARLRNSGVEVHTRSAFLQGLLLMNDGRPAGFGRWDPLWVKWNEWLRDTGIDPVRACLGFALHNARIDRVVIGVDDSAQLQEILDVVDQPFIEPPPELSSDDRDLVEPTRWPVRA